MATYWLFAIAFSALMAYDKDDPWWIRIPVLIAVFLPTIFASERIDEARKAARR